MNDTELIELIKKAKEGSYKAGTRFVLSYHPVLGWEVSHISENMEAREKLKEKLNEVLFL